jgi:hypothetical protein
VLTGTTHVLLNWGVLVALVAAVLVVRYHTEAQAREPLPPPSVHLSAVQAREWQAFPSYHRIVPVLLYHGNDSVNGGLSINLQFFAQQMLALKTAGFHTITLDQYLKYVKGSRRGLPSRPVLITIDGGRLRTYRTVNNILREYGFHATVFISAAWPASNPGANLTWSELQNMQKTGIWSVQEQGGQGNDDVIYSAAGSKGSVYAFRRYIRSPPGQGRLESSGAFAARTTSSLLWGEHQFAAHIPGYRPLAFAIPEANHGQQQTSDPRIPRYVLSWLQRHFQIVFGGDYLDRGPTWPHKIKARFSPALAYRIFVDSKMSLPALDCRLRDWVGRRPIWREYRCLRPGTAWRAPGTWDPAPTAAGPEAAR